MPADRDRLAGALTEQYGPPVRKEIWPYVGSGPPTVEPGSRLFEHLATWLGVIDYWQVGDRAVVVEVGQQDKELPLELMLVIGRMTAPGR